ncbi:MAG TPA: hypothetical protein DEG17_27170, partial [Cyanobacteria bacterium UBA11149]|nr:hypothetical protein [Cyanobacteria bacterium UBA11149]
MTDSPTTKGICEIRVKSDSLLQSGDRIAISTGEANRLWGVVSMVASLERINKIILQQPLVQVGRNNPSVVSRGAGGRG